MGIGHDYAGKKYALQARQLQATKLTSLEVNNNLPKADREEEIKAVKRRLQSIDHVLALHGIV